MGRPISRVAVPCVQVPRRAPPRYLHTHPTLPPIDSSVEATAWPDRNDPQPPAVRHHGVACRPPQASTHGWRAMWLNTPQ
ncbi:hypothetical protein DB811_14115 [Xanthomonas perforans]|uniref:Uncharacterized protein n=1 Tax=Xanthomonas perforans TaxID=442694 RepID=A0AAQ0YQA7_XANPE|nr:hypothetical protein BJD13_16725 [Xanthomonas perforans]AQS76960.1 hypothetical protein XPE_12380 [Xanthomonas perforans 91-118]OQP37977.1 hypothetical protein IB62_012805 [Xanthomonas euvesicatoria]RXD37138.1 hypothetical protein DB854_07165 [Xanthomonas perforans]RXD40821.1 hypothetical protein DB761_17710 [Xanthomonas perforans]